MNNICSSAKLFRKFLPEIAGNALLGLSKFKIFEGERAASQ